MLGEFEIEPENYCQIGNTNRAIGRRLMIASLWVINIWNISILPGKKQPAGAGWTGVMLKQLEPDH